MIPTNFNLPNSIIIQYKGITNFVIPNLQLHNRHYASRYKNGSFLSAYPVFFKHVVNKSSCKTSHSPHVIAE